MIFFLNPVPLLGAFHERRETRGGVRWLAMGRRNPLQVRFKPRPAVLAAGVSVEERPLGTMEQTVNTARGTPMFRRFVVTTLMHFVFHTCMGLRA